MAAYLSRWLNPALVAEPHVHHAVQPQAGGIGGITGQATELHHRIAVRCGFTELKISDHSHHLHR
jgi:hypothetical protein